MVASPFDLWQTDEENRPKPREAYSDDTVGRISSGTSETNEKGVTYPVALTEWRVSTGDMAVAKRVAQLYGGEPIEDAESGSENFISVFTDASKLTVIIPADGIKADMKSWAGGKLTHHCTGQIFLSHPISEDKVGTPCGCPRLFAERKEAAKHNMGPKPSIEITFRLADAPELGELKWVTGSWTLAAVLHEVINAMEDANETGDGVVATLALEEVSYVAKKGQMKGKTVEYTKPVVKVLRAHTSDAE